MKQKPSYYQQTSGLTRWRSSKQVQLSKTQVMVCFVGVYKASGTSKARHWTGIVFVEIFENDSKPPYIFLNGQYFYPENLTSTSTFKSRIFDKLYHTLISIPPKLCCLNNCTLATSINTFSRNQYHLNATWRICEGVAACSNADSLKPSSTGKAL